jgi:hypothetical protein
VIARTEHASVGQRMLWLLEHYGAGHGELNYPLIIALRGPLDLAVLGPALSTLAQRHEALRTTFGRHRGLLTQLISEPEAIELGCVPVGQAAADGLDAHIMAEVSRPIDPRTCAFRTTLWHLTETSHVLCINIHHLVTDAWSCRVLVDELTLLLGGSDQLPRPGWQYRHFVQWQRRAGGQRRQACDRQYWQDQLRGAAAPSLPRFEPGPGHGSSGPAAATAIELVVGPSRWAALRDLARAAGTTPFTVLLSLFFLVLQRETGGIDLCVSAPFANRERPETMRTVGFFATMLPLRVQIAPNASFGEVLSAAHLAVRDAMAHQGFPYLLPDTSTASGPGARRLEDVVFQMLPEFPPVIAAGPLELEILPPQIASRFEIEFCVIPCDAGLRVLVQAAPERGDPALARRLASAYAELSDDIASAASSYSGSLNIRPPGNDHLALGSLPVGA